MRQMEESWSLLLAMGVLLRFGSHVFLRIGSVAMSPETDETHPPNLWLKI